jgi:hypothetical protein
VKRAFIMLGTAAAIVAAGGWALAVTWHLSYGRGLYCALGTATTVGCDATPSSTAGRAASAAVMLTTIPLLAAVFALLTGLHLRGHIRDSEERMKRHLEERLAEHHKSLAVVPPVRKPKNGSSERMATRAERAASQPTVTDSRQLRDPKGRFM